MTQQINQSKPNKPIDFDQIEKRAESQLTEAEVLRLREMLNSQFNQKDFNAEHNHDGSNSVVLDTFGTISVQRINLKNVLNLEAVDYGGGTTDPDGSPESLSEPQEGWMYARTNYDVGSEDNIRVYIGGTWRSITTT
jgi:hypothetical protein